MKLSHVFYYSHQGFQERKRRIKTDPSLVDPSFNFVILVISLQKCSTNVSKLKSQYTTPNYFLILITYLICIGKIKKQANNNNRKPGFFLLKRPRRYSAECYFKSTFYDMGVYNFLGQLTLSLNRNKL